MSGYLFVFLGGGLGATLRHAVNRAALACLGAGFPTRLCSSTSSDPRHRHSRAPLHRQGWRSEQLRLFLATGLLGGFTTFSAFSLDAALMWQRGDYVALAAYVLGSLLLSIGALFIGMAAARAFL